MLPVEALLSFKKHLVNAYQGRPLLKEKEALKKELLALHCRGRSKVRHKGSLLSLNDEWSIAQCVITIYTSRGYSASSMVKRGLSVLKNQDISSTQYLSL